MTKTKIGIEISNLRKARNLTQANMAELLHMSEKTLSKIENDIKSPDLDLLDSMCEIFDITIGEMLGLNNAFCDIASCKASQKLLQISEIIEL